MMAASDSKNKTPPDSNIPLWIPLLAFVLLACLISAAGYAIFDQYKKSITENEVQNLGAIADLKVAQIVAWREEHRRWAEHFLHDAILPAEANLWLREGAPANERKQKLQQSLRSLQGEQRYKSISLLDKDGAARLSTNDSFAPDTAEMKLAFEAMRRKRVLFSDLHREEGPKGNGQCIDSVVPLMVTDEKKTTHIIGALLFEIDPNLFLYPLIQSWPTQSPSAETLLVRRDGDDVLFLNEVRHRQGVALTLRIPLTNTKLPSAQAVLGLTKVTEGIDYRGVPVVAALRSIPHTPWFMVAKIDKAELFAPINTLQRWASGLVFAFAAFGGALVFLWFKGLRVRYAHLKTQHDATVEREMLLKHFEYLTKYANDIIFLMDDEARILEANARALETYGYSREEFLTMNARDLRPVGQIPVFEQSWNYIKNHEHLVNEALHWRKDGSTFPVEVSSRRIKQNGQIFVQVIIRDITERKQAESALRKSEELLKKSQQMAHIGSWELDLASNAFSWSDEMFRIFEIDPARFSASYEAVMEAVHPDDRAMVDKGYNDSLKNRTAYTIVHRLLFPDQRVKFVQEWCETEYDHEGRPIRSIGTSQDITEAKLAEAEMFAAKSKLAATLDALPDLLFELGLDGRYYDIHASRPELLAAPPEMLIGKSVQDMLPPEAANAVMAALQEAHATGHSHDRQIELHVPQGKLWFELSIAPKPVEAGMVPRFIVLSRDITERKHAEERLGESYLELEKLTIHLESLREDEQKRIARELHDEMGGVLAALNVNVYLLAAQIPPEMADIQGKVADLERLVTVGIYAMQRTVAELRPALLDELGLKFAIKKYVQEFERNTEIQCDLRLPEEELTLDRNQSSAIFRIIQESLTNVAKHAKASRVSIAMSEWDTSLVLTVKDNGIGFDPNTQTMKSFGLLGIRERAAMLGGTAEITSTADKGTLVLVSLPRIAGLHESIPACE